MNCPKCGLALVKKTEKGEGNGPNGGSLYVMEEMRESIEDFDFDIEMWKCEQGCNLICYISIQENKTE